jgi:predicted MFS family arabinose efflux permease
MSRSDVEKGNGVIASHKRVIVLSAALFFASGFAALLYQVAWQRALFGWFGVDLDSVSAIVSVFMLGLGIGAMIGGWLADRFQYRRILIFSLIELTIGAFGFFSLGIIDDIGDLIAADALPRLVAITFIFFIVPTCAMGATLPVLVTELVDLTHNVGFSTGALYFINTLGAATGALAGGLVLLSFYGLNGLVTIATILNFLIAVVAYLSVRRAL